MSRKRSHSSSSSDSDSSSSSSSSDGTARERKGRDKSCSGKRQQGSTGKSTPSASQDREKLKKNRTDDLHCSSSEFKRSRRSSSSSSSSSESDDTRRRKQERKKLKKEKKRKKKELKKEKKRLKREEKKSKKLAKKAKKLLEKPQDNKTPSVTSSEPLPGPAPGPPIPELSDRAKAMKPMTKEEWDKRQQVIRKVYDEETGRHRIIKGDGEVLEEIVSRDRHREINRWATKEDGAFFQKYQNSKTPK